VRPVETRVWPYSPGRVPGSGAPGELRGVERGVGAAAAAAAAGAGAAAAIESTRGVPAPEEGAGSAASDAADTAAAAAAAPSAAGCRKRRPRRWNELVSIPAAAALRYKGRARAERRLNYTVLLLDYFDRSDRRCRTVGQGRIYQRIYRRRQIRLPHGTHAQHHVCLFAVLPFPFFAARTHVNADADGREATRLIEESSIHYCLLICIEHRRSWR